MRRFVHDWAPAAISAGLILAASSEPLAASHTGEWIQTIVERLTGSRLNPTTFAITHFVIRKAAHLTEYAVFSVFAFRAVRSDRRGWSPRWAVAAVAMAAALAAIDEFHQTFVPGRTGAVSDVFVDVCGATLSQLAVGHRLTRDT